MRGVSFKVEALLYQTLKLLVLESTLPTISLNKTTGELSTSLIGSRDVIGSDVFGERGGCS